MMLMDEKAAPSVTMGVPPMITGSLPGGDQGLETFKLNYVEGRALDHPADEGSNVAVLGSDIARKFDKHVGDTIELKGVPFEVIGVLEPTLTAPDQAVSVPLAAAQQLLVHDPPADDPGQAGHLGYRHVHGGLPGCRPGRRGSRTPASTRRSPASRR